MKFRFFLPSLIRTGNQLLTPSRRVNQIGCCKTPGQTDQLHRNIDILSFDGGGTKVLMALSTLHDVMRVATIIRNDPESLSFLLDDQPKNFLKDTEIRKKLVKNFEKVKNPIHPTEVYDMVAGTSAGALAAFALVGGEKDCIPNEPSKRKPMPLHKCIDKIRNATSIFKFMVPFCLNKGSLEKKVKEIFEDCCLEDFKYAKISSNPAVGSVAGALTRQIQGVKEDRLVFFDGNDHPNQSISVVKVLMASMNVPIVFQTPVKIKKEKYVDGGIGGNCPLVQAIPRAKVIFDKNPRSVLSVAPPAPKKQNHPTDTNIIRCIRLFTYWFSYGIKHITDGHAAYKDAQQQHGTNAKERKNATGKVMFRRLSPRGESLKGFKLLDTSLEKMISEIKKERVRNKMFMVDIVAIATSVVHKLLDKEQSYDNSYHETASAEVSAKLAYHAARMYAEEEEYENALNSFTESELLWNLVKPNYDKEKRLQTAEVHHHLGLCLKELEVFKEAACSFNKAIKDWEGDIDNALPNKAINDWNAKIATALLERAICLTKIQRFDEANNCYERAKKIQIELGHRNEEASICSWEAYSRFAEYKKSKEKKNFELALDLEKRALEIRKNILKTKEEKKECLLAIRADIAESNENLAEYLIVDDQYEETIRKLETCLKEKEKLFNEEKSKVLKSSWNIFPNFPLFRFSNYSNVKAILLTKIGVCFLKKGDCKTAMAKFKDALKCSYDYDVKTELRALMALCKYNNARNIDDYKNAFKWADQAIKEAERSCDIEDIDHPLKVIARYIRADCYEIQGGTETEIFRGVDIDKFNRLKRVHTVLEYLLKRYLNLLIAVVQWLLGTAGEGVVEKYQDDLNKAERSLIDKLAKSCFSFHLNNDDVKKAIKTRNCYLKKCAERDLRLARGMENRLQETD